jgi:hypothetical protein
VTFRSPLQAERFFFPALNGVPKLTAMSHTSSFVKSVLINDVLLFVLSYTFTLFCLTTHTTPHQEYYAWF